MTSTSDNDPHGIFVTFDSPGSYNIEVSGRSSAHAIERLVVYRSENPDNNISNSAAISLDNPESSRQ